MQCFSQPVVPRLFLIRLTIHEKTAGENSSPNKGSHPSWAQLLSIVHEYFHCLRPGWMPGRSSVVRVLLGTPWNSASTQTESPGEETEEKPVNRSIRNRFSSLSITNTARRHRGVCCVVVSLCFVYICAAAVVCFILTAISTANPLGTR